MTEENAIVKREPINIELSNGIKPKDYAEMMQFAALYKESGLAPKSFQTVPQLAIAIAMCLEVGRPIITGLADMAVINGKVGIFGDAALSMVRASGQLEYIKETESGEPYKEGWRFECHIKRRGSPSERVGIWTWDDSKRAGFDNPKRQDGSPDNYSPWRRFTRRMMQFKARNFVLRDEFGDVLRGMKIAEDIQDAIDLEADYTGSYSAPAAQKTVEEKAADLKTLISQPPADVAVKEEDPGDRSKYPVPAGVEYSEELAKEYINKRQGKKGFGGLLSWVMENSDRIVTFPKGNYDQLKAKFVDMYGASKWPPSLKRVDPPTTIEPEITEEVEEEEWTPPDCCMPCSGEQCKGQFTLYFQNPSGVDVCLHSPLYKADKSAVAADAKKEPEPEPAPVVKKLICNRMPDRPERKPEFCAKCIEVDVCGDYQKFMKNN